MIKQALLTKSRKAIAVAVFTLIFLMGWFATAHWTALSPNLGILKDALTSFLFIYMAGHSVSDIAHHFLNTDNKDINK